MFNVEFRQAPIPDPDREPLTDAKADHETAGVLRMFRGGMSAPAICNQLGISKMQLQHEMNLAIDDESEADRVGTKIVGSDIAQYKVQAMALTGWK